MSGRVIVVGVFLSACATLADGEPGLDNAPTSRAGPFRLLRTGEIGQGRSAPIAVDDQDLALRDPSIVDVDGDPKTLEVEGYFAASEPGAGPDAPPTRIVRLRAQDGRSFDRDAELVLSPTQAWEGGAVGAPAALGEAGRTLLFYAAAGGIGLVVSDGGAFIASPGPIVDAASVPWGASAPTGPGVVRLPDGTYEMFFAADAGGRSAVGRAWSDDLIAWTVDPEGPVLEPGRGGPADEVALGSPCPVVATSAEGRGILYVYFTATAADGTQSIALAARFLDGGERDFERSSSAMYAPAGDARPREPSVVRFDAFTFLFVTEQGGSDGTQAVVPALVAPATVTLPAPEPPYRCHVSGRTTPCPRFRAGAARSGPASSPEESTRSVR
jgi:hypothetical protein